MSLPPQLAAVILADEFAVTSPQRACTALAWALIRLARQDGDQR